MEAHGFTPLHTEKTPWRPQAINTHKEPACVPDKMDRLNWLFKDHGKTAIKHKNMPNRTDVVSHNPKKDKTKLEANIQWWDFPEEHRPKSLQAAIKHWDVFAKDGMKRQMLGCQFHINTGDVTLKFWRATVPATTATAVRTSTAEWNSLRENKSWG